MLLVVVESVSVTPLLRASLFPVYSAFHSG